VAVHVPFAFFPLVWLSSRLASAPRFLCAFVIQARRRNQDGQPSSRLPRHLHHMFSYSFFLQSPPAPSTLPFSRSIKPAEGLQADRRDSLPFLHMTRVPRAGAFALSLGTDYVGDPTLPTSTLLIVETRCVACQLKQARFFARHGDRVFAPHSKFFFSGIEDSSDTPKFSYFLPVAPLRSKGLCFPLSPLTLVRKEFYPGWHLLSVSERRPVTRTLRDLSSLVLQESSASRPALSSINRGNVLISFSVDKFSILVTPSPLF